MLYLYITYIYYNINYIKKQYIHVNTCKYFQYIYCMSVYLYIHNKYTQIYYVNKTFILDAINRLTALVI